MEKLIHYWHFLLVKNINSSYLLLFKIKLRYIKVQLILIHTFHFEKGNTGMDNWEKGERIRKQEKTGNREEKLDRKAEKEKKGKVTHRENTQKETHRNMIN